MKNVLSGLCIRFFEIPDLCGLIYMMGAQSEG